MKELEASLIGALSRAEAEHEQRHDSEHRYPAREEQYELQIIHQVTDSCRTPEQFGNMSCNESGKCPGPNARCEDNAESRDSIVFGRESSESWRKADGPATERGACKNSQSELCGEPNYKGPQNT